MNKLNLTINKNKVNLVTWHQNASVANIGSRERGSGIKA